MMPSSLEKLPASRLTLEHIRIPADAVQYGAGWHVHRDHLCAYRALEPCYAATVIN